MDDTAEIELNFEGTPFAFDDAERIRCLKCHDAGWVRNQNEKAGLDWETKGELNPAIEGSDYQTPGDWKKSGNYDRSRLDVDVWTHMVEESWRQIRHLGKQRVGYVGIFGGISALGVVFTVAAADVSSVVKGGVVSLLAIYTLFHTSMSVKMAKAYEHNMEHIDLLSAIAPKEADASTFAMLRSMKGMIFRGEWRRFQQSKMVPYFYIVLFAFWALLALYYFWPVVSSSLAAPNG